MPSIESSKLRLRITSDNMYDPANPHDSFMVGDIVIVDQDRVAKGGDFVIVSFDGHDHLMQLIDDGGVRMFRYMAPDRATFRMTDASAVITGVVSGRHRLYVSTLNGPLKWEGDDIGIRADSAILINLADRDGRSHTVSLRDALLAADRIDEYGLRRITSALSFAAEHGHLRPMDLDVWNEFKSDRTTDGSLRIGSGDIAKAGVADGHRLALQGAQSRATTTIS